MKASIKIVKNALLIIAILFLAHSVFAQNSVNSGIRILAASSSNGNDQSVFNYTQSGASVSFRTNQEIIANIPFWNFGDPVSLQLNVSFDAEPVHVYKKAGLYFIKCSIQNPETGIVDTIIYDTIEIRGITPSIQSRNSGVILLPEHKNQVYAKDTVDFVNTSIAFLPTGLKPVWDFDDHFSSQCTSYSIPAPGALLPFTNAQDLYNNSTHYYIYNGVTSAGKMNCRWSLDSLPRHKYANWDSVYSWLINGKTFPANWNLSPLSVNTPFTITAQTPVPDPFWLQQGKLVDLTSGTFRNRFDSITINDPVLGVFKRYANAIVPNTNITFHELVFRYLYTTSTKVKLTIANGAVAVAYDTLMMSLGKPLAYGLGIGGNIGRGRYQPASFAGKYVEFSFYNTGKAAGTLPYGQSDVLFNFDSLADRQDQTPCDLDGFFGYTGGQTTGGLEQPGFNTMFDWTPPHFWQDGTYPKIITHYGPHTVLGSSQNVPADSNGIITIGVIVANGVGNDKVWSDTVWYRQAVNVGRANFDVGFTTDFADCEYRPVGTTVKVNPNEKFVKDIRSDTWYWGDDTYTVDSFWDAGYDVTNLFYKNGLRRVRYNFDGTGLLDSIVNPMGFAPHTAGHFYQAFYAPLNLCGGNNRTSYYYTIDSAWLSGTVTHTYKKPSYWSATPIYRAVQTKQQLHSDIGPYFYIGKMAHIDFRRSQRNDTLFCAGDEVLFLDSVKYFRRDCAQTDILFNPNINEYGQVLDAPYNGYHFDTANYWSRHSGRTTDIKRTYFNTKKGKTDTIYYEKLYWDFTSDGIIDATGTKPKYRYAASGVYKVTMITRDSLGYFDTTYRDVYVTGYAADFTWEKEGCGRSVLFTDISAPRDQAFWKFSATHAYLNLDTSRVLYTYPSAGTYEVTMISLSKTGCRDTVQKTIDINGLMPRFTIISDTAACAPFTATIVLHADDTFSAASTTIWWGDSANTSTVINQGLDTFVASFMYDRAGTYHISTMRSYAVNDSCSYASQPKQIIVYEKPAVNITGETNPVKGETYLYASNVSKALRHDWVALSASIVSQDSNTIVLSWDTTGNYALICTAGGNLFQCSQSDTINISVGSTGITETGWESAVGMYPNPANNKVRILFNHQQAGDKGELLVYDVFGRLMHKDSITTETSLHVVEWPKGIYLVSITIHNKQVIRKLVVE